MSAFSRPENVADLDTSSSDTDNDQTRDSELIQPAIPNNTTSSSSLNLTSVRSSLPQISATTRPINLQSSFLTPAQAVLTPDQVFDLEILHIRRNPSYLNPPTTSSTTMTQKDLKQEVKELRETVARKAGEELYNKQQMDIKKEELRRKEAFLAIREKEVKDEAKTVMETIETRDKSIQKKYGILQKLTESFKAREKAFKEGEAAVKLREEAVTRREEAVKEREEIVEWAYEQQEAVLMEANEAGIEIAGATIEQRLLLEQELKNKQARQR